MGDSIRRMTGEYPLFCASDGVRVGNKRRYEWEDGEGVTGKDFNITWDGDEKVALSELSLFGADSLTDATSAVVVEGEGCATALHTHGYASVSGHGGANFQTVGDDALRDLLTLKKIFLWPDNDDVGRAFMFEVAKALHRLGFRGEVCTVNCPSLPKGGDVVDAAAKGVSIENALSTAVLVPPPATLEWILDELAYNLIRRFIFLTDKQAHGIALWVAHTYVFMEFMFTPYLYISSAVFESGKSSLLELLVRVVSMAIHSVQSSPASIVRDAGDGSTLCIDELDSSMRNRDYMENVMGVFNGGFRKGGAFRKVVGEGAGMTVKPFPVYCPKALAGNSSPPLPPTIASRSIGIAMKKMREWVEEERVDEYREEAINAIAIPIKEALDEWADQTSCWEYLGEIQSLIPEGVTGRKADMWEPLFCVAYEAGDKWIKYAQEASPVLVVGVEDGDEYDRNLLRAIKEIFDNPKYATERYDDNTKIAINGQQVGSNPDDGLLGLLQSHEKYDFDNLTSATLSKALKRFDIEAGSHRMKQFGVTKWGVMKSDFEEAWSRYLPPEPNNPDKTSGGGDSRLNGNRPTPDIGATQTQMLGTHDASSIA